MHIVRGIVIAFSVYSKIPVPQFQWEGEDMKYMLCFFPWIGAVIGGCVYLWNWGCWHLGAGDLCRVSITAAIPLVITGGFHVDGFMDTMDAFRSYQPRERKLEILKDAHIGAFAVIMLAVYGLIYVGAFSEIRDEKCLGIVCMGFFLARCFSGIGVVCFPSAKKEGMLYVFADGAQKRRVKWVLILQAVMCVGGMLIVDRYMAGGIVLTALAVFGRYYWKCKKELGGITGDTAGWFVVVCEGAVAVAAAGMNVLL